MFRIPVSASTLILAAIAAIAASAPASPAETASVFKCIDRAGGVAFQAVPCNAESRQQQVTIAPAPPVSISPDYANALPRERSRSRVSYRLPKPQIVYSFECRTIRGALFYRHNRCPSSIDRSGLVGGRPSAAREAVSGRRIPRLEACRGMRSVGRDGREFDEVPSTYDRNLGRDPCRRY